MHVLVVHCDLRIAVGGLCLQRARVRVRVRPCLHLAQMCQLSIGLREQKDFGPTFLLSCVSGRS